MCVSKSVSVQFCMHLFVYTGRVFKCAQSPSLECLKASQILMINIVILRYMCCRLRARLPKVAPAASVAVRRGSLSLCKY